MKKLNKLPQELINQIAAGEVIERPSSIVKELIDNSIDAGASIIKIKIEQGGLKTLEISDNGIGISPENLPTVFEAHTTSKISTLEDLNNIITMGFRGEALSTIVAVSQVSITSKTSENDTAYSLEFDGITPKDVKRAARDIGTTITVRNIFHNIPARQKFLKTAETEYRKIIEIATPFLLYYPNIQFIILKDGKEVINTPTTSQNPGLDLQRIQKVLKADHISRMFQIEYNGAGISITGYSAHPKDNYDKVNDQYIFVNNRSIWDFGIAKSVRSAYSRFIPNTQKVPFVISIKINSNLVDVNVHPRKEEVRFENPYRVYSAIEEAVSTALQKLVKTENSIANYTSTIPSQSPNFLNDATPSQNYKQSPMFNTNGTSDSRDIRFDKAPKEFSIQQSLNFSKEILEIKQDGLPVNHTQDQIDVNKVFQIFNKYIIIEHEDTLIMMDQHAAAERISFEKLEGSIENKQMDKQALLMPLEIEINESEASYIKESKEFFGSLGFTIELENTALKITSVPSIFSGQDIEKLFREIFQLSDDQRDIKKSFENAKQNILATLACHGSIRKGQPLTSYEGLHLYLDLMRCSNPYSCPHGRPAIWKQKLTDIDTNFYRTY